MDDNFDVAAASAEIGAGLGLGPADAPASEVPDADDASLDSTAAPKASPAPTPAAATANSPAPAAAPGTTPAPASAPAADGTPTAPPAPPAPKTWRPEAQGKWESVDPTVKAEILKREEDTLRGISQYRQAAQVGETFHRVIQPYQQLLQQHGADPVATVSSLLATQAKLASGTPEQRVEVIRQIAQAYGVSPDSLDPNLAPYVDPSVKALQDQVQALQNQLQSVQTNRVSQVRQELSTELDRFTADPAHAYFDEVANDMAKLLQTGAAATLKEAYETAVWANPATRAKELARMDSEKQAQAQAQQASATAAAAAKTAAARRATGVNVRSGQSLGTVSLPKGTMDETLQAAYEAIQARG